MNTNLEKVAPCGTVCSECLASSSDQNIINMLISKGFPKDSLPCKGCRAIKGHCPSPTLQGKECEIWACTQKQNINFCSDCSNIPCDRLSPIENWMPYRYHNMKAFNLLYIKNKGLDAFCAEAKRLQKVYFEGKLKVVGSSPESD